jgi:hypothetical protein
MNKEEATSILEKRLGQLRKCSYADLKQMVEVKICIAEEAVGESGNNYQIEIEAVWDNKPEGHILVLASIDDGGWSSFRPLTRDFIIAADGSFVGRVSLENHFKGRGHSPFLVGAYVRAGDVRVSLARKRNRWQAASAH